MEAPQLEEGSGSYPVLLAADPTGSGRLQRAVQIRLHGRGGQGTVTAAELLSVAAFEDGLHAQAFPSFGSERMGAPVEAYCRISRSPIRTREPVSIPDVLIVQDASLIEQLDLFAGLPSSAFVLVNTTETSDAFRARCGAQLAPERLLTVPATQLALEYLGRATPNSVLLGGFSALTGLVSLDAVRRAIAHRFADRLGEANAAAATAAFDHVRHERQETAGAPAG